MAETIIQRLEETAAARGEAPAMLYKQGDAWRPISWNAYRDQVLRAARGLLALGLAPGEGVVIIGFNRPEWFVTDLATIAAGGVPAGIYTTSTPEQCRYIAGHAGARIAVVENADYLAKLEAVRGELPKLTAIVLMEGVAEGEGVHTWQELLDLAAETPEEALRQRLDRQRASDLATLIYTSGTTGPPKAVMLSHRNILWTSAAVCAHFDFNADEQFISYLPLSHIAEQMVTLYGTLMVGGCAAFAESIERLPENLREVRPHVFFAVPRVWEKIQAAVEAAGAATKGMKKRIARWARRQGLAGGYAEQRGEPRPALYGLAERLVFRKVRRKLGLDRARLCVTSAAPISLHTLEFFLSLGIQILEVYGMSECTGPATLSTPQRCRTGRAGFAIPGTELSVSDKGEVLMRGPHVFLGYYKDPEATREAVDDEGWLHSGDVGELDEDGFLRITDRMKELIITSGGKNVAPQPIEARLKAIPGVALSALIGDRRKYLAALLTLDPDTIGSCAGAAGSDATDAAGAARCAVFRSYLEGEIAKLNATLSSYETIKRFAVLPGQFTVDGGELTPTMKLKRRVILEKYASEIEALYA